MATAQDVVTYSKSLVGQKVTVPTNPYGGQCVALIDHIVQHFSDGEVDLAYTNAKDGLTKAKQQGLEVIYNDGSPDLIPQAGDFFVCQWGSNDSFGHIGVVVSADQNGMTTIEQNIDGYRDDNGDGINDQLQEDGGGYTRDNWRNYEGVIGWFRLPYDEKKKEEPKKKKEILMFTTSAPGRGIALIQGGRFMPFQKPNDPVNFWSAGVPHINVAVETFDDWQRNSGAGAYDQEMVKAMRELLKEAKK